MDKDQVRTIKDDVYATSAKKDRADLKQSRQRDSQTGQLAEVRSIASAKAAQAAGEMVAESKTHADGEAGYDLIDSLVEMSGLPKEMVEGEISQILETAGGLDPEGLTLDQFREAMKKYLNVVDQMVTENSR